MNIVFDRQLNVIEITNPNDKLFFGKEMLSMLTNCNMVEWVDRLDNHCRRQGMMIISAIRKAVHEKRNVYLEYVSIPRADEKVNAVAHIGYIDDERVILYATQIAACDMYRIDKAVDTSLSDDNFYSILQTIYKNMPVGLEVYDCDGNLIEINRIDMEMMGVRDKSEVLGKNLFDNPNVPATIKTLIREGKDIRTTLEYDFDKAVADGYYHTSISGVRYLDMMISVVKDAVGKIDKYLLLLRDVTEHMELQEKYKKLYNQNQTILESLPVGVEVFTNDGNLLYLNDTACHIFGSDKEDIVARKINIYKNPNLPDEVKSAVRDCVKIQASYSYDFNVVAECDFYTSSYHDMVRQIACSGTPILNSAGKMENYVFIVSDVTDSVKAQEELRRSKRKVELAMKASDIVLWEYDCPSQMFYSENDPFNNYNGEMPISAKKYMEAVHPDDLELAKMVMKGMLESQDEAVSFDLQMKYPNSLEWQYCTLNSSPFEKDSNGKVVKYVGFRKNNTVLQKKKLLQDKILNSIPLPIHIKDVDDDFRYVFCNQESKRLFGSVEQKTAHDILDDEQVDRMQKTDMEVFSTGKPYFGQERIVLKDGRTYDTIVRKSVIYDNGKRLLLNVRWDQSLQNDLERRAKVLSISMNALNAYTWLYDPVAKQITYGDGFDKTGGDYIRINTIEKFATCIHPDDRHEFLERFYATLEKDGEDFAFEYRIDFTGNNAYEWWECRGVVETIVRGEVPYTYVLGMSINIEGHKKTELTLLKNKEKMARLIQQNELVLNNTNSGLAYISTDYVVQWENVSTCSASLSYEAYKKGEYCYKSAHNRTSPCEGCVLQRAIQSGQMEQIKFKLNNKRSVEVFATPVFDDKRKVDGIVVRIDDITEQEQMIEELKKAKAQAEQSDKLKSAFLANMSHEIRTPLNAIVGFSDLLMISNEPKEKKEYMRIINTNNELLLKLINDILDLSKIEAGSVELKYEEFDIAAYFNELASAMQQRVNNSNVRLLSVNPYSCCIVKLDKNRFAQILTNYVTNAIKYTPKGFIEVGYEQVEEGIRLYVKDTGIGIADDKKNKVFNRFEKLDEFAQGTGLGLSICKAIADACGGSLGFESEAGQGSLFWAILPCSVKVLDDHGKGNLKQKMEANDNVKTVSPLETSGEKKVVIVAEDIQSNYLLISALLQKDYDLIHANNGQEAVDAVRLMPRVDLVLMDMKMPEMDGITATREIRKFNDTLPIVALTAHAFDADRQVALAVGCNDYLVKPISKLRLMDVLKKYC